MAITAPVGRYNWIRVVDVMTKDPLTVTPVETIGQADELMNTNKIRQLPVVQGKDLVGIVTDRDIRSFLSGSLLESPEEREKALNSKISDIMTTEPITLSPDDDLEETVRTTDRGKDRWNSRGSRVRGVGGYRDLCRYLALLLAPIAGRIIDLKGEMTYEE